MISFFCCSDIMPQLFFKHSFDVTSPESSQFAVVEVLDFVQLYLQSSDGLLISRRVGGGRLARFAHARHKACKLVSQSAQLLSGME